MEPREAGVHMLLRGLECALNSPRGTPACQPTLQLFSPKFEGGRGGAIWLLSQPPRGRSGDFRVPRLLPASGQPCCPPSTLLRDLRDLLRGPRSPL